MSKSSARISSLLSLSAISSDRRCVVLRDSCLTSRCIESNITGKWGSSTHDWKAAMNQFAILYDERFTHPQRGDNADAQGLPLSPRVAEERVRSDTGPSAHVFDRRN